MVEPFDLLGFFAYYSWTGSREPFCLVRVKSANPFH